MTAKTTHPTVLLLDVMDTLVVDPFFDDDFGALFGLPLRELLGRMTPDLWPAFERGEIDRETYFAGFFKDGSGVESVGVRGEDIEAWMAERYRFVPGIEALLGELRAAGVPMYALSNYPVWWRMIEERLGLGRYLEWRFVSCMTGVRKPHPESYLGAARSLGVAPEACLFVDDREGNCSAARDVGLHAHCFDGAEGLRAAVAHLL